MTEIATADRSMIEAVLHGLREEDVVEMYAAGTDPHLLAGQLMRHRTFAYCAWDFDCGPISVWGMIQKRHGVGAAFAFGTKDWDRAVIPMVRQIRGFLIPLVINLGYHRVEAVALRRRDDVRRFMNLLGAQAEGVLTGYGVSGEDFVSYRWLSDEYACNRAAATQADRAYAAH